MSNLPMRRGTIVVRGAKTKGTRQGSVYSKAGDVEDDENIDENETNKMSIYDL